MAKKTSNGYAYEATPLIWLSVGEVSGDIHAAALREAFTQLAPEIRFTGMGGPALGKLDFKQEFDISELSVMGLTEVITSLPRIINLLARIKKKLHQVKPDALILVDAPDFNFRVARMAYELGIPTFYYISPKVWAWRKGRIKFLKRYVKRILCILPFEEAFYAAHGVQASYVGNPLMDQIPLDELDRMAPDPKHIALMPGSRRREINSLMPHLIESAMELQRRAPDLTFSLLRAPGISEAQLRGYLPPELAIEIVEPENRYPGIRKSRLILAASGTATLEAALIGTPCVIIYRLSKLSFMAGKMLVDLPYVGLPNLILHREVFPELLQSEARADFIVQKAELWLKDEKALEGTLTSLKKIRTIIGPAGASQRAAQIILQDISSAANPWPPAA